MSMQIQPLSARPLAAAARIRNRQYAERAAAQPETREDRTEELRSKRQQLQNEILLLRGGSSDSAELSADRLKNLEVELEDILAELRTGKPEAPNVVEAAVRASHQDRDRYEPGTAEAPSAGIYRPEPDSENGYTVAFAPCAED